MVMLRVVEVEMDGVLEVLVGVVVVVGEDVVRTRIVSNRNRRIL